MSKVADNLEHLCQLPDALLPMREEILAKVVMLSQIPAPTGDEEQRSRFLLDRFTESGLPEAGPDEKGNAVGFLPGQRGEKTIMLVAHLDTIFSKSVDHNISVQEDRIIGPGVSDNAAGAAVMSLLPRILDRMSIDFDCNLQLIGTVHSLHRGDHEGLRFFLEHVPRRIDFGIVVEGV